MPAHASICGRFLTLSAALTTLLLVAGAAGAATLRQYEFDVLLDERPIGTHSFEIATDTDGSERISSEAAFDVRFLGFSAYRYRHRASEQWESGCLVAIESETSDNGRTQQVRGRRVAEGFMLQGPERRSGLACVVSYAYWDLQRLLTQRKLLNPQTGEFDAVRIEAMGRETLHIRGANVSASRYRLAGPQYEIDLWYAESGEWMQLESSTGSKRRLRYRLRD